MSRWWMVAAVALVAAGEGRAQGAAALAGRVTDAASGLPVAAEVVVDGVRRTRADDGGRWRIDGLAPGRRSLRIRYPGYRPVETAPDLAVGEVHTVDTALQQAIVPLSAVVVTAARREQRLADAVVETELITLTELRRSGATDVSAAISDRVGVQLDGGVPAGAGVQIRGFDSRRVLVLLDGQPMTGRLNGNLDLSRLPLEAVERVEVVKGPQSTLYGSEAMGGVINIITRRPPDGDEWTGAFSATLGSDGRRETGVDAGWRGGGWGWTASAGRRAVDLAPGVAGDASTFAHRWDGLFNVLREPDSLHRYEAGTLIVRENQRYRTGQLFHFGDNTQIASRLGARTPLGQGRLTSTLSLSRFSHLSRASTGDRPVSDSGASDVQTLVHGSALFSTRWMGGNLDAGTDARVEHIAADRVTAPVRTVMSGEPFLQYAATVRVVQWSSGVRLTLSDRWGSFVAPRVAALWRPRPALALRAAASRGFRAPDFKEMYYDFVNVAAGYAVRGNPALRPERSTTFSLGAEWDGARVYAHASAFHNAYRDFIEYREPDAAGTYTYDNVSRGSTAGVEVEGGAFVGPWRLDASGTKIRSRDNTTHLPLLGRPAATARLTADGPLALGVRTALSASWTGRTPIDRSTTGQTTERASFLRVDARFARAFAPRLEMSAGVTNLFDRRLGVAWPGFTGRQLFVATSWRPFGSM